MYFFFILFVCLSVWTFSTLHKDLSFVSSPVQPIFFWLKRLNRVSETLDDALRGQ